ncbi:MAG: outer membrane beta-barrel protein [Campylobacterota bacterium]|nr:outer membrane beta-barrel protein [Campylobacterota bacterium]
MKKILLILLLLTSLYSYEDDVEAKIYTGISIGYMNESFSDQQDTAHSAEMLKFKIGYGVREAYAVEFSLDYIKNETDIFSEEDGDKYGLNVELIKAFDWDIFINPYFKAGFGAGYFHLKDSQKDSLNYGSFNLGLGFYIPINEHVDIAIGYDYKYVSYEKLDTIEDDINSFINGGYAGVNVRF